MKRSRVMLGAAVLVAAAACGKKGTGVDDGLSKDLAAVGQASDLQLAPRSGPATAVVSAIEAGPTAAPAPAVHKPVVKPVTHPAPLRAEPKAQPAPAPAPVVAEQAPAPRAPQPVERATEDSNDVPPLPPFKDAQGSGKDRQKGRYGTEGEIFSRAPWIRP